LPLSDAFARLFLHNLCMTRIKRPHLATTWLALWALVLSTCLPTLSHAAVQLTDRQGWVEVCTSTGMVWVRADLGETSTEPPQSPAEAAAQVGCAWCLAAGGSPALLHEPPPLFMGASFVATQPLPLTVAWVSRSPHTLAQPRAPPATHWYS